jgi:hypothetical protein
VTPGSGSCAGPGGGLLMMHCASPPTGLLSNRYRGDVGRMFAEFRDFRLSACWNFGV